MVLEKFDLESGLLWGVLLGIGGYILGTLLMGMDIFPSLLWDKIGLFSGVVLGMFKSLIK